MGTPSDPTEPDYETGNACTACSGLIFTYNTPKYVQALFDGIVPCPPLPPWDPMNNFILKQTGAFPCQWLVGLRQNGTLWECHYWSHTLFPGKASILELLRDGLPVFYSESAESCLHNFANQNDCTDPEPGKEGTGGITWGPDIDQTAYDAQNLV